MLWSVNLLYDISLNSINESIPMTEGRTLASHGLQCGVAIIKDIGYAASKHCHRHITQLNAIYALGYDSISCSIFCTI